MQTRRLGLTRCGRLLLPVAMLAACGAMAIMTGSALTEGFSITRRRYIQSANNGSSAASGSPPRKTRRVLPFAVPVAMGTWLVLAWLLLRSQGL